MTRFLLYYDNDDPMYRNGVGRRPVCIDAHSYDVAAEGGVPMISFKNEEGVITDTVFEFPSRISIAGPQMVIVPEGTRVIPDRMRREGSEL